MFSAGLIKGFLDRHFVLHERLYEPESALGQVMNSKVVPYAGHANPRAKATGLLGGHFGRPQSAVSVMSMYREDVLACGSKAT